jgi:hypothetical protein
LSPTNAPGSEQSVTILDRPSGILYELTLPPILLGTSSFTATGWQGSFYPKGMPLADYFGFYAEHFHTVEVDLDVLRMSHRPHS